MDGGSISVKGGRVLCRYRHVLGKEGCGCVGLEGGLAFVFFAGGIVGRYRLDFGGRFSFFFCWSFVIFSGQEVGH